MYTCIHIYRQNKPIVQFCPSVFIYMYVYTYPPGCGGLTSVGQAAVDQLVHEVVAALGGGALVAVQVGRDVVGGELLQDLLLQGGLLVVAVGAVAPAAVQDLDAVAQVLTAGHAVVVGVVTVERQRIHDAGVPHVVQHALWGRGGGAVERGE